MTNPRLAFHEWASKNMQPCELSGYQGSGDWLYDNTIVELCWQAWKAGGAAELAHHEKYAAQMNEVLKENARLMHDIEAGERKIQMLKAANPGLAVEPPACPKCLIPHYPNCEQQMRPTVSLARAVEPSATLVGACCPECKGTGVIRPSENRQDEPRVEWLPIETAPKDENEVIVGVDIASVWITRGAFYVAPGERETPDSVGWWSYKHSVTQEKLEGIYEPTHWLPMPETPSDRETQEIIEANSVNRGTDHG